MSVNNVAIAEAVKVLRIQDIYFRDEQVAVASDVTPGYWPTSHRVQFKMVTKILREFELDATAPTAESAEVARDRFLEIEFLGSVRCLGDDDSELLKIEVSIGLLYKCIATCSSDSVDEFVRLNAPYHAMPYWREHVHTACLKRRFKPITVPLY